VATSTDEDVRLVSFATLTNLVVKSTTFPYRNTHKYSWTSPDGKTKIHINDILIDRRWHSSILDNHSFKGADCNTDKYLVVENVGKRLSVSKRAAQKYDMEIFSHKELNDVEVM
jgi:hypothetical protein